MRKNDAQRFCLSRVGTGMSKTDRQTDKTTRWAFTAYEDQFGLFDKIPDKVKEWGWQTEICPTTERKHYQGYILTRTQQRHKAMRDMFPGVHIEVAREWNALVNYCKKIDTAIEGTQKHEVNERKYLQFADALVNVAKCYIDPHMSHAHRLRLAPSDEAVALSKITPEQLETKAFDEAVCQLVEAQPNDVSLYTNPQIKRAWIMCKSVWLRMAQCQVGLCIPGCKCDEVSDTYCQDMEDLAHAFFISYDIIDDDGSPTCSQDEPTGEFQEGSA